MTGHEYLLAVLRAQTLSETELAPLRSARDHIEGLLRPFYGQYARFYYGGSFAKKTMIRAGYDLDIIVYGPDPSSPSTWSRKDYRVGRPSPPPEASFFA